jgi:hypothetical protein
MNLRKKDRCLIEQVVKQKSLSSDNISINNELFTALYHIASYEEFHEVLNAQEMQEIAENALLRTVGAVMVRGE